VLRFAGGTAFVAYASALVQNSIWYRRAWCTTPKQIFDGLIYGRLTAGTFGWLWPLWRSHRGRRHRAVLASPAVQRWLREMILSTAMKVR
jgi:hypothetical protein